MKVLVIVLSLFVSLNASAALKGAAKPNYTFETSSGKEVPPAEAVELAIKGEKVWKITVKGYKTTRELVEAVVNDRGTVSLKAKKD